LPRIIAELGGQPCRSRIRRGGLKIFNARLGRRAHARMQRLDSRCRGRGVALGLGGIARHVDGEDRRNALFPCRLHRASKACRVSLSYRRG